jgi:hypothetical protein
MACTLKDPVEKAQMISQLEDDIASRRTAIKELLKDDAAVHRELAKEKMVGDDTTRMDGIDNRGSFQVAF